MALRLNLAIGVVAVLGFGTVCAVSAVNLDRLPSAEAPVPQVAAVRAAPEEPAVTGALIPAPVPVAPKPRAKSAKAETARDPAFDSERLAQLLSAAAAGTARPIDR
ncbi:hypothetical protein [Methylobacterium sp. ID0610]|uniref:hypothetical protein n=1 Tax=Methylobacterium carpenticola TaxID=3344827 RepID=UPI0036C56597